MGRNKVHKILTLFGTRPEVIKLAPVIHQLEAHKAHFQTVNVTSGQHVELLYPFVRLFDLRIDHDLQLMELKQTPDRLCARVLEALEPVLLQEQPDLVLVQGDTTTTLAGALSAFHQHIPVGHIEAGLRSGNPYSPYPEEMNRQLVTRLARYHFAATPGNRDTLLAEGVHPDHIRVTGNPVVDALYLIQEQLTPGPELKSLLESTKGLKRLVVTTHRRENLGTVLVENLRVLRRFVEQHDDLALICPVHPNPAVMSPTLDLLSDHPRICLMRPLSYPDFITLLTHAWLIVSDSGGVQEEVPSLGKPLLIIRENTERPEVVESGIARLVGGRPERLASMLEEVYLDRAWHQQVQQIKNPFGGRNSSARIAQALIDLLAQPAPSPG